MSTIIDNLKTIQVNLNNGKEYYFQKDDVLVKKIDSRNILFYNENNGVQVYYPEITSPITADIDALIKIIIWQI